MSLSSLSPDGESPRSLSPRILASSPVGNRPKSLGLAESTKMSGFLGGDSSPEQGSPQRASPKTLFGSFRLRQRVKNGVQLMKRIGSKDELSPKSSMMSLSLNSDNPLHVSEDDDGADDSPPVLGISLEYLQDLRIDEDATVAGALEAVMEAMEDEREAKEVVGKAHAVVLYSPDMHWGDFVATLARIGTARRVWLREVHTAEQTAERDVALGRVRNVEIVLPSWANSAAFWTPEMCAATRACSGRFTVLVSEKDEQQLIKAMARGLPLSYFDNMLVPPGTVGAGALRALKAYLVKVVDTLSTTQFDQACVKAAYGHMACALGNYEGAVTYYEALEDNAGMLGEAYRRWHRADKALAAWQAAMEQATDPAVQAQCALQLSDLWYELGEYAKARAMLDAAMAEYERARQAKEVAECTLRLGKIQEGQGLANEAKQSMEDALMFFRTLSLPLKTAEALACLGRVHRAASETDEALKSYSEALLLYKDVLGEAHKTTLQCEMDLARLYTSKGEHQQAADSLKHVYHNMVLLHGTEHPAVMEVMGKLANALLLAGYRTEGREMLEQVHEYHVRVHGAESEISSKMGKRIMSLRIMEQGDA